MACIKKQVSSQPVSIPTQPPTTTAPPQILPRQHLLAPKFISHAIFCVFREGAAMAGRVFLCSWLLLLLFCTPGLHATDADSDFRFIPHEGEFQMLFFCRLLVVLRNPPVKCVGN